MRSSLITVVALGASLLLAPACGGDDSNGGAGGASSNTSSESTTAASTGSSGSMLDCCLESVHYVCPDQATLDKCAGSMTATPDPSSCMQETKPCPCDADADCGVKSHCVTGLCYVNGIGSPCDDDEECAPGACVNGVCH